MSLIPGSERSPAGSHGNTLQHSCLENMNRGAWPATVQGVASVMPDYLWRYRLQCLNICCSGVLITLQGSVSLFGYALFLLQPINFTLQVAELQ